MFFDPITRELCDPAQPAHRGAVPSLRGARPAGPPPARRSADQGAARASSCGVIVVVGQRSLWAAFMPARSLPCMSATARSHRAGLMARNGASDHHSTRPRVFKATRPRKARMFPRSLVDHVLGSDRQVSIGTRQGHWLWCRAGLMWCCG